MDIPQLQKQAQIYLQQEDFNTAIDIYTQCLENSPDDIYLYWYLGLSWLLLGDTEKCHEIWLSGFTTRELANDNTDLNEFIEFLKKQGEEYFNLGKYQISQKIYEAILEWDDHQTQVYYNLGHTIANQGDLETAISYWETVVQIQPDYLLAHLHQAYIWYKLENFDAAITSYQKSIVIESDYFTYYQLALCYTKIQAWELAQDYFLQSIQMNQNYAPSYSDLGFVLLQQGDIKEAVKYFHKAININDELCQCLANIPAPYLPNFKSSTFEGIKLIQCLINSLNNSPDDIVEIYLSLSKIIVSANINNAHKISLKLIEEVLKNAPGNLAASLEISNFLFNENQFYQAITILENVVDVDINQINDNKDIIYLIYFNLGRCWLKLADYQKAILNLTKSIKINYQFTEAYYLLGVALFQSGNFQEAINILKEELTREFKSPVILAYSGFILANNRQFSEAKFYFEKAIETNSCIIPFIDELLSNLTDIPQFDTFSIQLEPTPKNFYESTKKWLESENLLTSHNYMEIYPEIDVELTVPKSLNQEIHFSFRFGNLVKLPASYVVKIPQGRFWLSSDQTQSAIMTDESHFLGDLSPYFPILSPNHPDKHPSQHPMLLTKKLPSLHFIDGRVAVLAGLRNDIYFHWMLDVLPRWELLTLINLEYSEIDYFVVDNRLPFQKETLKQLHIPENKQINVSQIPHLQARELIVPSFPGCVAWMSKWTCEFLQKHFLKNIDVHYSHRKRIYITRKLAKSRRILNEDTILNILQSYGFEVVILEALSVAEQAVLFSQAEVIISPHGSGLTNLVFCQPGTQVIELFSPNYVYHCYWWVSNLVGLDYYYLIGETLPGWYLHHLIYPQEFAEDIFINIRDLLKLLEISGLT